MWLRTISLAFLASALGGAGLAAPAAASAADAASPPDAASSMPPAAAPANVPPAAAAKPLICQSQDETGSHVVHRICLTQAQWDSVGDDAGPRNVTQVPVIGPARSGGFGSAPNGH
jgi:hypothetical protein